MMLKDKWVDKIDGESDVRASDINDIARSVIVLEEDVDGMQGWEDRIFDLEPFEPVNILAGVGAVYVEGYYWGSNGSLIVNDKYNSISEPIAVLEGQTYKIPKLYGVVALYDENMSNHEEIKSVDVLGGKEVVFTVPTGKTKLGISYNTNTSKPTPVTAMYRMTPTEQEVAALPLKKERFSLMPENLKTNAIKDEIAKMASNGFEADVDLFEPPNVLEGLTLAESEGSMWLSAGALGEHTNYNSVSEKIEVMPDFEYMIPKFRGFIQMYDSTGANGTQVSFTSAPAADRTFIVPTGVYYIGISYIASTEFEWAMYRLTMTQEEADNLPLKNDDFSIFPSNIKNEDAKSLLARLKDKIIVNFGDSIFGNARPPKDISTTLAKLTGATVHNCAFGGCRMATHKGHWDAFSMYRLADAIATGNWSLQDDALNYEDRTSYAEEPLALLKSIDFNEVDIVTIAYGTNDWAGAVTLDNGDDMYDTRSFGGALRYSIERLLEAYPNLKIFVLCPTYRFWTDDNGAFTEDSDTKSNGLHTLPLFIELAKEIAKNYHIPFIDNYYDLGINKYNRTHYFPDNDSTHHNENGRKLIAEHITKYLF